MVWVSLAHHHVLEQKCVNSNFEGVSGRKLDLVDTFEEVKGKKIPVLLKNNR